MFFCATLWEASFLGCEPESFGTGGFFCCRLGILESCARFVINLVFLAFVRDLGAFQRRLISNEKQKKFVSGADCLGAINKQSDKVS